MTLAHRLSVLFIDNRDSFVFNLVDEFARRGCAVSVHRNEIPAERALTLAAGMPPPRLIVLSPGPGRPEDAGCCESLVARAPCTLPLFGVCLGLQAIIRACGGTVGSAGKVVHGRASRLDHDGLGLFQDLPNPLLVGRYHSLIGTMIPDTLRVTARIGRLPMAVEHTSRPVRGVQFHPESVLTPRGAQLIAAIIAWARLAATLPSTLTANHNP